MMERLNSWHDNWMRNVPDPFFDLLMADMWTTKPSRSQTDKDTDGRSNVKMLEDLHVVVDDGSGEGGAKADEKASPAESCTSSEASSGWSGGREDRDAQEEEEIVVTCKVMIFK